MSVALDVYKEWLGIPEGPRPPDHYELLRLVRFEDDAEKIRKHYRKLNAHVRKYASGEYSVQSQELLNELAKAMLCLTDPERKRDYDQGLGREPDRKPGEAGRMPLEDVLVERGVISTAQRDEVRSFADARGLSMRDAVVQMKLADADTAAQALAQELGLSYVDLSEMLPDDSVLDKVPRNVVKRNGILPLFVDDDVLLVACVHQLEPELEEELRLRFDMPVRGVIATPLAVNQGIAKHYAPGVRDEAAAEAAGSAQSAKSAKSAKARPARKASGPLTEEERKERRQWGLLFICWGIIIPVLVDEFVLKPYVLPQALQFPYVPSVATLLVTPIVVLYVLFVYWKK